MKHFVKALSTIFLINLILLLGAIFYANDQRSLNLFDFVGLHVCGGSLCLQSVELGKTQWQEAKRILGLKYGNVQDNDGNIVIRQASFDATYYQSRDNTVQLEITSTNRTRLFSAGDLIAVYGAPCSMTLTDDSIYLEYPNFAAGIDRPGNTVADKSTFLTVSSQIVTVNSPSQATPCLASLIFPSSQNVFMEWCGFANRERYLSHCIKQGQYLPNGVK